MHNFNNYIPYTKQQIFDVVQAKGSSRYMKFRYDILNQYNQKVGELKDVQPGAEISCDNEAAIKKSLQLTYRNNGPVDFMFQKLRPVISFLMADGTMLDFPQGLYIIGSKTDVENTNSLFINLTMFDELKRLDNDKTDFRYYIPAGTLYYDAMVAILNKFDIVAIGTSGNHAGYFKIDYLTDAFAVEREWDIGKSYLEIFQDIIKDINYRDLWTDENGIFRTKLKMTLEQLPIEYTYTDDKNSIQFNGVEKDSDYFDIPNKWIVTASNPDNLPLVATLLNQPDISYRGQTMTKFETIDYIANQPALNNYITLLAENDKVTETVIFDSAIVAFHDVEDVYQFVNQTHGINTKYKEKSWNLPLEIGAKMHHEAYRKVEIYD